MGDHNFILLFFNEIDDLIISLNQISVFFCSCLKCNGSKAPINGCFSNFMEAFTISFVICVAIFKEAFSL